MQKDLAVTGVSRSGRVRKKSSKLMDFESPDDIETKFRRQTLIKTYSNVKHDESVEYQEPTPQRPVEEAGTADAVPDGSESDYYENNAENGESMDSDSSVSDENSARTPANSLYMMEKCKKKIIVKDGRVVGRAKAQRKDKGKTRITAYMMWAKEARNELLKKHPDMDFSAISKRLGEMWANVNYNERYLWKRKAKRFAMQKEQSQLTVNKIISKPSIRPSLGQGPGRPSSGRAPSRPAPTTPPRALVMAPRSVDRNTSRISTRRVTDHSVIGKSPRSQMVGSASNTVGTGVYRMSGCGAVDVAAHLRLLGESLAIIGERLKEHEGQIAVSGSVSVLLDTLLCSLAPLLAVARAVPAIAPPHALMRDTLHNIAYIMPGL